MDIEGKNALVLGGPGMAGMAVSRALLLHRPAVLVVAALQKAEAEAAAAELQAMFPEASTRILPSWGDVFLRAEWLDQPRQTLLSDPALRRRLVADILDPLDDDIVGSSLLSQTITGAAPGLDGAPAQIVVDCMNTATVVSYQDIYASANRLVGLTEANGPGTDWPAVVEQLLASLSLPQLVRHLQLLDAAMRRAGTEAYLKVGHQRYRRHGLRHSLYPWRGEAVAAVAVQGRPGRRPEPADLPDGPDCRRPAHRPRSSNRPP